MAKMRAKHERSFFPVPDKTGTKASRRPNIAWVRFQEADEMLFARSVMETFGVQTSMASSLVLGFWGFEGWRDMLGPWFDIEEG